MASTRDQRVDDALQQLVARLLPPNSDEDEALEDQRWDEAIQQARHLLGRHDPFIHSVEKPSVVSTQAD